MKGRSRFADIVVEAGRAGELGAAKWLGIFCRYLRDGAQVLAEVVPRASLNGWSVCVKQVTPQVHQPQLHSGV